MMPVEHKATKNLAANLLSIYNKKVVSADEAVKVIKSGDNIMVQPGCAVPITLINAMVRRKDELFDVKMHHILTIGNVSYFEKGMEEHFRHVSYFIGNNARRAVNEGRADHVPIFLSEVPHIFLKGVVNLDVALIHVSPPDEHGFCSYGIDVGVIKSTADKAKIIIAQVNPQMPRSLGDSFIHINKISIIVEIDEPIQELTMGDDDMNPETALMYEKIGRNIADLIEDGSTLQLGIGVIPDAVLKFLSNKRALGVHSEMFSDGVIDLVDSGVITNEMKTLHRGKMIAGFALGTKRLYDFIHNNPIIELHPQEYVNDPFVIAKNYKMVAINSAIEIDITGQVCADSMGPRMYSGFGGQVDFIRGAARSEGGKPIIALPSSTKNDTISRIVSTLKPGAGVVTSRADVHYVVTEHGVAFLHGKPLRERVKAMINIAHPNFRDELTRYAKENKYI